MRFQRALLLNPPTGLYRRDDRCQCKVEDQTVQITFPPMELASIGAVLRRAGAEVRIRDYPAVGGGWDTLEADLAEFSPDFVLFNVVTATAAEDFQVAALVRELERKRPNADAHTDDGAARVITAARGEYMDALGMEALEENPALDLGFHGEIEEVIVRYLEGAPLESVSGLVYREPEGGPSAGRIRHNPGHPVVEDLDALPFPARDLLRNEIYISPETGRPLTVLHGNRGCPAACIYCPAGVMSGFRVRYRSPASLMDEIRECVEVHGIREFLFHGDTFTLNRKWLLDLCERIIQSGLAIRWGCNSRVDTIDDERARAMKAAGCWVVAFGVESGSQEMLDRMKKGAKVGQAREAVEVCRRNGLRTHAFFVIGLPWETDATLEETYRFARELNTDFFDFNIAYPLPGTEYYEMAVAEGLFEREPGRSGYADAAVRTHSLSSASLTDWRRRRLLKMYLRPNYIARTLWRSGSPRVAANYVRAGAKRLRQLVAV